MTYGWFAAARRRHLWRGLVCLAVFGLVCGFAARVAAGDEEEKSANDACFECHSTEGMTGPHDEPLYVGSEAYAASVHGVVDCTACHTGATPEHEALAKVRLTVCADCHEDAVAAYNRGVHGSAQAKGIKEAASCTDCHGNLHTTKPASEPESSVHWSNLAATCARCHRDTKMAEKFGIPVVRPVEAYLKSAHARAIAAGKHGATCSDCHGSHEILPGNDPQSSIWHARVPQTCGNCHAEILAKYKDSVHGVALQRGNRDVPVCTDCHGEHRIVAPSEPSSPVFAANLPGDTCGRCHGNERLVEKYGLRSGSVGAFADSFHGMALRSGRLTVANCSSCHGVHDIRASSDPKSSVHPANLRATCGKCHAGAGQSFALGPVHSTPDSFATHAVGWVRFLYLSLIAAVIGGMVAHNLLDLSHKVRHPQPPVPFVTEGRERMSRVMRWQHGMMMLSFPVLVYTGFALTYPESWWAAPILRWETHLSLRALVHRCAAIVMTIGFVWHLGYLAVNAQARRCMRGFIPGWRDVRVFFATLAWYLGRRAQRPSSGAVNYAEKAEYWAFMWGTVLMTCTGLLLWFENQTLRYLPSWVADVATAIHFYEALLATLAILVWHFYWVIFDPDVYPMDWSWRTGKAPASREHERQESSEDTQDTPAP